MKEVKNMEEEKKQTEIKAVSSEADSKVAQTPLEAPKVATTIPVSDPLGELDKIINSSVKDSKKVKEKKVAMKKLPKKDEDDRYFITIDMSKLVATEDNAGINKIIAEKINKKQWTIKTMTTRYMAISHYDYRKARTDCYNYIKSISLNNDMRVSTLIKICKILEISISLETYD